MARENSFPLVVWERQRERERGVPGWLLTLSVVLSHARHCRECEQYITHSATSMSLFSLSPFASSFSIGKTKNETDGLTLGPKDEWRLEFSFTYPSIIPKSFLLSSFFLCFSAKSHINDHSFLDMSCERAENSLSQNTRTERNASQNGSGSISVTC